VRFHSGSSAPGYLSGSQGRGMALMSVFLNVYAPSLKGLILSGVQACMTLLGREDDPISALCCSLLCGIGIWGFWLGSPLVSPPGISNSFTGPFSFFI
jgi:hypothetical protein